MALGLACIGNGIKNSREQTRRSEFKTDCQFIQLRIPDYLPTELAG